MPRRLAPWLIAAGVVAAALAALWTSPPVPALVGRGAPAPDFRLPRLDGGAPVALDELKGRVVLVNFWATWCKPCEDEMPAMERLYRALADEPFELLAVSVDDDREQVVAFAERLGVGFPILLDPDEEVARRYQTFRYPETFLISADGVVLERFVGPRDWDAKPYEDRIRSLLAPAG
jgi:peroxiredoxin